ncbi:TetR family transcriptional regulator [Paenibacillus sp. 598K]|uniref:TetR/AcrR family transcriptional regulator n=1 Tax=Paenibacillus sp. 598K TaxID=1117987 RepID=UPI000FFA2FC1|nr:TetR/AcrR family transcriptional regulator [Paenibacillus sp. 598K]GBF76392.1 TetR family transcriptional regulator [Paenibacillus sp. 598K]
MKKNTRSNKEVALQSAFTLFLTKGFLATSMDDIVAHSKVSKTNIYYYFKTKEELLLATVNQLIAQYEQQIDAIASRSELSVQGKLTAILRILTNSDEQPSYLGGCPFLSLYTQTPADAAQIRERIKHFFDQQLYSVEMILSQGIAQGELRADLPVRPTATLIVTSIEGALFLAQASNNPELIPNLSPALASLLK